ncbi:MAG: hypothetical protein HYU26_16780 [Candidatus Rokubacteria bacterium]|nr:hypothetical protein [Candidatus Rokubacteria bacterium]
MASRVLLALAVLVTAPLVPSRAPAASPALPAEIPAAERDRLQKIAETASVATRAAAEPFVARREIFEFLLDHPEFATHVTRALKLARYRIWRGPEGLWLDDGWGAVGQFAVVFARNGTRVMYARGRYQPRLLPSVHGQAVIVIEYGAEPAPDSRALITATVAGYVKLDSRVLSLLGKLAGPLATAKAEKEARTLMKVFARVSRAIEENPAAVHEQVRARPDVPPRDLEEFRQLLNLR